MPSRRCASEMIVASQSTLPPAPPSWLFLQRESDDEKSESVEDERTNAAENDGSGGFVSLLCDIATVALVLAKENGRPALFIAALTDASVTRESVTPRCWVPRCGVVPSVLEGSPSCHTGT